MKTQSNTFLAQLTQNELRGFANNVKETIAFEGSVACKRMFTTADLWNVQKRRKERNGRRFMM